MKKIVLLAMGLLVMGAVAQAAPATFSNTSTATGWGPSAVINTSVFYLDGHYAVAQGGGGVGTAYTFNQGGNVDSVGFYVSPQIISTGSQKDTSLNLMAQLNLFQTKVGSFGIGLLTQFWASGKTMDKAISLKTTGLTFTFQPLSGS